MTVPPDPPETALRLLFGPHDAAGGVAAAVGHASTSGNLGAAIKALPEAARDAAGKEVAESIAGLLRLNLIDLLIMGWRTREDLSSAAHRTLETPGSTELVQLASHQVNASQQPQVAILVQDHQVAAVHLDLSVAFDVSPLLTRVRAGRLASVLTGSCDVTAALAIDGIDITSSKGHLDLPGEVTLANQPRLLPAAAYPPGACR
jgi:hypothetical protein